jgi:hypothetical protein
MEPADAVDGNDLFRFKAPHHDSHDPGRHVPGGSFKKTKIGGRGCGEWSILHTLQKLKMHALVNLKISA